MLFNPGSKITTFEYRGNLEMNRSRWPHAFFASAAFYAMVGVCWGLAMGMTKNHATYSAHAHLNLLGWLSLAMMGTFYATLGQDVSNKVKAANFVDVSAWSWPVKSGLSDGSSALNCPESTTRSVTFTQYPSTVTVKSRAGFQENPILAFSDFSSVSSGMPAARVMGLLLGAIFTSAMFCPCTVVKVLLKLICWREGARKPVLNEPRRLKLSAIL